MATQLLNADADLEPIQDLLGDRQMLSKGDLCETY